MGIPSILHAVQASSDEDAIRRDLSQLEAALQAADPTAWVYCHTDDAILVGPGDPPVRGRAALLEIAKSMARCGQ